MEVLKVIKYGIGFIQNPLRYLCSVILHHPFIFGSILLFTCLIKLFYKLIHISYTGTENMNGKTVLITGATDGIGKATAFDLAKRNARVLLACSNVVTGNEVADEIMSKTGNQNVIVKSLDLSSFESVRQCAKSVLETEDKLHVLINNENILYSKGDPRSVTNDGCDIVMQTNHFGPFLLTLLLIDLLKHSSPSRIINVTAEPLYSTAIFDVEDLNNERGTIDQLYVYYNSKLARILFTRELSKRLQGTGVTVNSVYPGMIPSDFVEANVLENIALLLMGKTFEEGAQTIIRLAVDSVLERTTGEHFYNCNKYILLTQIAKDMMLAKRLFQQVERTVGVSF